MAIYLGLDCGGSSCRALALDDSLEPVFLAQGGSANLATSSDATLDRSLRRALEGVPTVDYVCACFAGLMNENRTEQATQLLQKLLPHATIWLEPDFAAALRACPTGTTACVIAGTGSIVCSHAKGQLVKSGGGGYLIGDEGSGFRYGQAALRHYIRRYPDISDSLRHAVEYVIGGQGPNEITVQLYRTASPAAVIAGLSTALLKDAQAKDPYALAALDRESEGLAAVVSEHLVRYHRDEQPQLGLAGGLWKRSLFREAFVSAIRRLHPDIEVRRAEMPPVRGAALLAYEKATQS